MSLVGTRPILQDELQKYELHHRARIAIKPGITGMWQVSGRSDITDFEEVVRLDTEYISNWTFEDEMHVLIRDEAAKEDIKNEYIRFLRGIFKGTEPTKYIQLAYLTGILPIKKEKTQSALNNFDEFTI